MSCFRAFACQKLTEEREAYYVRMGLTSPKSPLDSAEVEQAFTLKHRSKAREYHEARAASVGETVSSEELLKRERRAREASAELLQAESDKFKARMEKQRKSKVAAGGGGGPS